MADEFDEVRRKAAARRGAQAAARADQAAARRERSKIAARSTWKPSADELHEVGAQFASAARSGRLRTKLLFAYTPPFVASGWIIYKGHAASGGGSRHGTSWSGSPRSPRLEVTVGGKVLCGRRGARPGDFPPHVLRVWLSPLGCVNPRAKSLAS